MHGRHSKAEATDAGDTITKARENALKKVLRNVVCGMLAKGPTPRSSEFYVFVSVM